MKIAITADPLLPVPPMNYGGIERIIDFLVTGLAKKGHEVVLVAHQDSKVNCKLIPYQGYDQTFGTHLKHVLTINQLRKFNPDIIHSFSRIAYLLPFFLSKVPKIMSYQREPTISQVKKAVQLVRGNSLSFTGCSNYISDQIEPFARVKTVYNGVNLDLYQPSLIPKKEGDLVFLGRIEPIKGTHIAVEVAFQTKRKLIIAGNIPSEHQAYFEEKIAPFLSEQINYVGPVNDQQKNEILGNAASLLMPIEWNEPFGIVMAEAMACGTPVIGLNRGAVPEIVNDQKTGFICNSLAEMVNAVGKIDTIDRKAVRQACENRFASDVIVADYLKVYESLTT